MTDPTIDKAALEAAITAFYDANNEIQQCADCGGAGRNPDESNCATCNGGGFIAPEGWDPYASLVRGYLRALPPTTDGVRVTTVRELIWHPIMPGSTSSVADASFGEYTVEHYTEAATGDGWLAIYEDNRKLGYFGTEAAAKSACAEDRTARVMSSLNISEAEPVAWQWRYWYSSGEPGVWLNERRPDADDLLENNILIREEKRPLYAFPTTSPLAPEGVRDDVLDVLRNLTNTADGLSFREDAIRNIVGNTNWRVLRDHIADARKILPPKDRT